MEILSNLANFGKNFNVSRKENVDFEEVERISRKSKCVSRKCNKKEKQSLASL